MIATIACALSLVSLPTVQRAVVDITPPELLPLGGYTARGAKVMEPGGEPLFARVTILTPAGDKPIAVVVVDMLTVPESLASAVRERIAPGIRLFLIATHTHSAPDSQMLNSRMTFSIPGIASFKSRWLEWYAGHIAQAIESAREAPRKQVAEWDIRSFHASLNRGRRIGALPDRAATVIGLKTQSGESDNLWLHYAAHAVFHGPERLQTSGDWPGRIANTIGASVLVGAIGDVSPAAEGATPTARIDMFARTMGDRLAEAPLERVAPSVPIRWVEVEIPNAKPVPHPDFARSNRIPDALAQNLVDKFAPPGPSTIVAFRIGKTAIVGVPGEPTSHLGRRIRDFGRNVGFEHVLVCSHVNGWIGYILDAKDYARGGYEATLSLFGPNHGEDIVAAGQKALLRLVR